MKKTNNKGFSFIELILVLGVAAILVGLISLSYGYVHSTNVTKTGDRMVTVLHEARTSALTKGTDSGYCNIMLRNGALYAYVGEKVTPATLNMSKQHWEKIADRKLDFYYGPTVPANKLAEGTIQSFQFKQATGGLTASTAQNECTFQYGNKKCKVSVDRITGKSTKNVNG